MVPKESLHPRKFSNTGGGAKTEVSSFQTKNKKTIEPLMHLIVEPLIKKIPKKFKRPLETTDLFPNIHITKASS
jgi:hypothetical protein